MVNNKLIHTEELGSGEFEKIIELTESKNHVTLIVENMGRANYGGKMDTQRKGVLEGSVLIDEKPQPVFFTYALVLCSECVNLLSSDMGHWASMEIRSPQESGPAFYRSFLKGAVPTDLQENHYPPDTFLNFKVC